MCINPRLRAAAHRLAARTQAAAPRGVDPVLRRCGRLAPGGVLRSRKGMGTLEFALVGSALITLFFAIMEAALYLTTIAALEWTTLRASRFGMTGSNAVPGATAPASLPQCRSAMIPWLVSHSTGGFLKPENLTVTTAVLSGLGAAGAGIAGAGEGGKIVRYSLSYRQDFITPIVATLAGRTHVTHNSSLVIKNEPFENDYC